MKRLTNFEDYREIEEDEEVDKIWGNFFEKKEIKKSAVLLL